MTKQNLKRHGTKTAFLTSLMSLILCFTMLVGTTLAWFTDSVTSGENQIIAGNLDVEVTHVNASVTTAESIADATNLWNKDADGNDILWEPGVVSYETFTVENKGTLALTYKLLLNELASTAYNTVVSSDEYDGKSLMDVLYVHTDTGSAAATRPATKMAEDDKTITELLSADSKFFSGNLEAGASSDAMTVYIYWPTGSGNEYNLQNGKKASDVTGDEAGQLWINLSITATATQFTSESDSFNNQYDKTAGIGTKFTVTVNYSQDGNNPTAATPITVPAGTTITVDGQKLTVDETEYTSYATAPDGNFQRWEYSTDGTTYTAITESMTVTSNMTIRAAYGYLVRLLNMEGNSGEPYDVLYTIVCPKGAKATTNDTSLTLSNQNGDTIFTATTLSSQIVDVEGTPTSEPFRFWGIYLLYNGTPMYWVKNADGVTFGDIADGAEIEIKWDTYFAPRYAQ